MRFTLGGAPATADNAFANDATFTKKDDTPAEKVPFLQNRMVLVIAIGVGMAVLATLAILLTGKPSESGSVAGERVMRDINLRVKPPEGWESDEELRLLANANILGLKKTETSARAVLATADYKTRQPQPGELKSGLDDRVRKLFEDADISTDKGTWLGQPATKVVFRGRSGADAYAGEGYAVGAFGRAYWILQWCLESDFTKEQPEFEAMREACKLVDPKLPWKATEAAALVIASDKGDYHVSDGDRWWEKQSNPETEDPKADMLLKAKFRTRPMPERPPIAWACVNKLPHSDDPMGALRQHVQERFKKHFGTKKLVELSDDMQGDPPASGMPAEVKAVRYKAEGDIEKFVVLHTIEGPEGTLGLEAWCPWEDREKWERKLVALANSLQR